LPESEIIANAGIKVIFKLVGQRFLALNGGLMFKKNASISLYTICESEEEINFYSSIFPNSSTNVVNKYDESDKLKGGKINHAQFTCRVKNMPLCIVE
jgi:predicted 3-demethylubiquinone-9 3-methyltransferase (glyoxalase superfamily)